LKEMTKKELQQDRDDWKAIAEMNAEMIDELRAIIDRFQSPKSDTLAELKELANADRLKCEQKEIGFAYGVLDGQDVCVCAKKVGYNKPGRTSHVRYEVSSISPAEREVYVSNS
jgi:hypothetical protein